MQAELCSGLNDTGSTPGTSVGRSEGWSSLLSFGSPEVHVPVTSPPRKMVPNGDCRGYRGGDRDNSVAAAGKGKDREERRSLSLSLSMSMSPAELRLSRRCSRSRSHAALVGVEEDGRVVSRREDRGRIRGLWHGGDGARRSWCRGEEPCPPDVARGGGEGGSVGGVSASSRREVGAIGVPRMLMSRARGAEGSKQAAVHRREGLGAEGAAAVAAPSALSDSRKPEKGSLRSVEEAAAVETAPVHPSHDAEALKRSGARSGALHTKSSSVNTYFLSDRWTSRGTSSSTVGVRRPSPGLNVLQRMGSGKLSSR